MTSKIDSDKRRKAIKETPSRKERERKWRLSSQADKFALAQTPETSKINLEPRGGVLMSFGYPYT